MAGFEIRGRKIGEGGKVFVVAELGANHNGDVSLAREMIRSAAACGADAVKLQTYTAASLLADYERMITWGPPGRETRESVGGMFDRLSLPAGAYRDLFDVADKAGVIGYSTPFSVPEALFLDGLGAPCYKIASSDVTYMDLLHTVAGLGKPVFLSTGKSTLGEVDRAIRVLSGSGDRALALLHCVAQYPSPASELNLRTIPALAAMYPHLVIGFSDHSVGASASLAAVALGARVIEKHFTMDRELGGPDHWFSADPAEFRDLVKGVREVESALGRPRVDVLPCELQERTTSTRSLVLKREVKRGQVITGDDLSVLRPGWGIHPYDKEKVMGLKATSDLPAGTVLEWKHLH